MNIKQALSNGCQLLRDFRIASAELDAEILLSHATSKKRTQLYSQNNLPLTSNQRKLYRDLLSRRASKEPIAYITSQKEFYGLPLTISRHVLIPRPETETLVELALERLKTMDVKRPQVIDIGTGSGAITVALAKNTKGARFTAVDVSKQALKLARYNAQAQKVLQKIKFKFSDLLSEVSGTFDLIVANLPYLTNAQIKELPVDILDYEPRLALAGGPDGLHWYENLMKQLPTVIKPGTILLCEIGPNLKTGFATIVHQKLPKGSKVHFHNDASGRVRVAEVIPAMLEE